MKKKGLDKFPLVKMVVDYASQRVGLILVTGLLAGGIPLIDSRNAKNTVWQETGSHLMDAHNEIYSNKNEMIQWENAVSNLEQRVEKIERKQHGK
jgi:hypothetical protein